MKKLILVLILTVTIFACKSDKKNNTAEETAKDTPKVEVKDEENIIITVNAVVPNDDIFIIHFTEEASFKFTSKNLIKTKVVGSTIAQEISFTLPDKVIPTKFMLKVGTNNMENVIINGIAFNNEGREFKVDKNKFFQYLNPNKFIDYNKENKTYTTKKVDGRFSPAFMSRKVLIQRLEERVY